MTADKIYLVGFMACGKSTVARALGSRLGWRAEDIDDLIEARERRSIAEDFRARQGEAGKLRAIEREMLPALVLPLRHAVVATGGGTFADPENRSMIVRDGVTVWLDVPLPDLIGRIPVDGRRPLAADRGQLERLYAARVESYQFAQVRVPAGQRSVAEVVERTLDAIEHLPPLLVRPPDGVS